MEKNFKEITDELAIILDKKNQAYGNSFDKTMTKWGMTALGIRLDDKLSRINSLITDNASSKNNESLLDNLFDTAGYAILGIRFLIENDLVSDEDLNKYFE